MYKKITTIEEHSDFPINGNGDYKKKYGPCVKADIPLMLKVLEFAHEHTNTDVDLHVLVTNMVTLSGEGHTLTMDDYEKLLVGITPKEPTV
jgi:hypothetical protein